MHSLTAPGCKGSPQSLAIDIIGGRDLGSFLPSLILFLPLVSVTLYALVFTL